jgi:hypothetical protein
MSAPQLKQPFNNAQIEILNLFRQDLNKEELDELRDILLQFKLRRLQELEDNFWDENGINNEQNKEILQKHLRTPYKSQNLS